jgi:galactofuranosylgalactofuranosylrhamnosyl-N-acetylglucosaminyl-diphospho-decaprenol beta-1,5/1,6-galactofuranosyltransferase
MLHLDEPTRLHSYGERVDRRRFWWTPVVPSLSGVDLAACELESTPALSGCYDVDFNGWWMCLVPVSTIRRVGAALPVFIKWDDAEFGLRAGSAGTPTVTLPGAAVWHMPWTGKDDGLDWQAYHHVRNRLLAALLHSDRPRGGSLLPITFAQDVNHVLCLQYGSAAVRQLAVRDVLTGPSSLGDPGRSDPALAHAELARFGQVLQTDALPEGTADAAQAPRSPFALARRALAVAVNQMRRPSRGRDDQVDVVVTRAQGKWWSLGLVDSAVFRSATGRGGFVLRRGRRLGARLLVDAFVLRARLWWSWPRLARAYRRDLDALSGLEAWRRRLASAERADLP